MEAGDFVKKSTSNILDLQYLVASSAFHFILSIYFILAQFAFSLLQQNCKKRLGLILLVTDLRVKDESVAGGREGIMQTVAGVRPRAQCTSAGAEVWAQISDVAGKVRGCSRYLDV